MNIPQHVVLFPDGNRRWAKANNLPPLEGHKKGYEKLKMLCDWCENRGVKALTAFGFSTENWNRSNEEIVYLMKLLEDTLVLFQNDPDLQKKGVRLRIIGQKERLPASLQKTIQDIEVFTKDNNRLLLNLAVSYGGKWDILQAVKKIIQEKIPPENIDEALFENHLSTAGLPEPDLIIRAGGEMRLSNFVLWQGAYSELYFSPKLWPDFTKEDLDQALEEFDRRTRRFGK
ncbi:MAG: di-trans,poly-cis-decaprenylcistransferase [Candidatus Staskawiczbacteria bacterium RIFCSPHIGHO2_02_FULL_42_22]|uniref:Isoprenyl transferase n=1 Tax=Candidatus Staskawiczbacteria bacterium RIFCSPHIGHO2_02_FULL_42_22 TaxID=1802207 RepID=A0A1G2I4T0_9BACT|nr:MAG: di-trans,poly-cis-decaprenylcistransferase [Candidatus Staskawiczbacteria bacterium RIFCSPHIGHO2_02_FULL_42_22]